MSTDVPQGILNTKFAAKITRRELVSHEELSQFSKLQPVRVISIILFDFFIVIATAAVCEHFFSPVAYILAVMIIGSRQVGIGTVALHEGVHRLVIRNRAINDIICRALARIVFVELLGTSYFAYRRSHLVHHRVTNTIADADFLECLEYYSRPRRQKIILLCLAFSGALFLFGIFIAIRSLSWQKIIESTAIIFLTIGALWMHSYVATLLVLYWIVPIATWGSFVNMVRHIAEHYPYEAYSRNKDTPPMFLTRDVVPTWFDSLFVTTRGVHYHLTHHLFPSVPFFNLKALHKRIAQTDDYRTYAHVTHGYHRVIAEIMKSKQVPWTVPEAPIPKAMPGLWREEGGRSGLLRLDIPAQTAGMVVVAQVCEPWQTQPELRWQVWPKSLVADLADI